MNAGDECLEFKTIELPEASRPIANVRRQCAVSWLRFQAIQVHYSYSRLG